MAELSIQNLDKNYGKTEVLKNINVEIKNGEFVVLVGPSGCGKSTLLRTIAGLEELSAGNIHIGKQLVNDVDPSDRGVAMVFQSYALYPHMNVFQNMSFGLTVAKMPKNEIKTKVEQAASILKIEHLLDRKPKQLSGGQRQRVAIGRAIVREPKVFLFDEPLSNLDAELRVQMRIELVKLHNRLKSTMVYVTHDQIEAMTMADKIVVLRDGIVEQVGTPDELYNQPINLFVASFIGSPKMNLFQGTVTAAKNDITIKFDDKSIPNLKLKKKMKTTSKKGKAVDSRITRIDELETGETVTLGVRPEHLSLEKSPKKASKKEALSLKTVISEVLGSTTHIHCRSGGQDDIIVEARGNPKVANDKPIKVYFEMDVVYLFDHSGQRVAL